MAFSKLKVRDSVIFSSLHMQLFIEHGTSVYRLRRAAFLLALVASVTLCILPVYSGKLTVSDAGGRTENVERRERLVEVNGIRGVVALVAVPLVFILPLIIKRAKPPVAILMLVFTLAAFSTIGMFYLPSTVLLFWPDPG